MESIPRGYLKRGQWVSVQQLRCFHQFYVFGMQDCNHLRKFTHPFYWKDGGSKKYITYILKYSLMQPKYPLAMASGQVDFFSSCMTQLGIKPGTFPNQMWMFLTITPPSGLFISSVEPVTVYTLVFSFSFLRNKKLRCVFHLHNKKHKPTNGEPLNLHVWSTTMSTTVQTFICSPATNTCPQKQTKTLFISLTFMYIITIWVTNVGHVFWTKFFSLSV